MKVFAFYNDMEVNRGEKNMFDFTSSATRIALLHTIVVFKMIFR